MDGLTHKQRRFVEEYLLCASATKAAINAGYSARSAQVTSSRLMDDPKILAAIEEAQAERSERTQVDADYLLKRLHEEVDADIADLYDEETGDLLPVHEWPPVWRRGLVAGVEIEAITADGVEVGKVKKLKLSDRVRRIEALGRHVSVNAFRENIRVEGLDGLADRIFRARKNWETIEGEVIDRSDNAPALQPTPPASAHEADETHSEAEECETSSATSQHGSEAAAPQGDWAAPAAPAVYVPVLPYPERTTFADCDYSTFSDGLIGARRND